MSGSPAPDREREPAILLLGWRRSGKTRTRMRWSQYARMAAVTPEGIGPPRVETGAHPAPTAAVTEHRIEIGERAVRVIDVPGAIVDAARDEAGALRDALEPRVGRIGGIVLCVAPPVPPRRKGLVPGHVHPSLVPAYGDLFPAGETMAEPAAAQVEEVRARIDAVMAFVEQFAGRMGKDARDVPIDVQINFADLVALGSTDDEDAAARDRLFARYGRMLPADRGAFTNPAHIEARRAEAAAVDADVSALATDIADFMRARWPGHDLWFSVAANVEDPLGHRSAAAGLVYLVDRTLGEEALAEARAKREEARRVEWARRMEARRALLRRFRPALVGVPVLILLLLAASTVTWGSRTETAAPLLVRRVRWYAQSHLAPEGPGHGPSPRAARTRSP
ncbi:hypothetical protein [Polyangium fumosum]|uniref:Uncharacterized protein n=1 Tax=Polyangium fumosum TaxID=889272 RepID=A0A4U1J849_9BACT|nr:hypothetical protein [Polyangium fumosum]TKD02755.1 hypothetical protein E8A74_28060 [Polyangium fumosum]